MTTKELRHRAEIALACLPDAPFRKVLGQLFDDMLAAPSTSHATLTDEEAWHVFQQHNCTISAHFAGTLARALAAKLATPQAAPSTSLDIDVLINELTHTAACYHDYSSLRQRIADVVSAHITVAHIAALRKELAE